jgi:hypothetical protein
VPVRQCSDITTALPTDHGVVLTAQGAEVLCSVTSQGGPVDAETLGRFIATRIAVLDRIVVMIMNME